MQWYIHADGAQYGPADVAAIEDWIRSGAVRRDHFVWDFENSSWMPIGEHPAFSGAFGASGGAEGPAASSENSSRIPGGFASGEGEIRFPIPVGPDGHRRNARTRVEVGLRWRKFSTEGAGGAFAKSRALDISLGGISFLSAQPPRVGMKLKIHVDIPDGKPAFAFQVVVKRVAPHWQQGIHAVGCAFINVGDEAKSYLIDRLEKVYALIHD